MSLRRAALLLTLGALLAGGLRWGAPAPEAPIASSPGEALLRETRRLGWDRSDPVIRRHLVAAMRAAGATGDDAALLSEAWSLGLDRTDPVVRSRLLDRARRALAVSVVPEPGELSGWWAEHPERFRRPERVRYAQAFLAGEGDLTERLAGVPPEEALALGDPLLDARPIDLATPERVGRFLGAPVAEALRSAPVGEWVGPVPSPYGRHWLLVLERIHGEVPALSVIEAEVLQDWRREVGEATVRAQIAQWGTP